MKITPFCLFCLVMLALSACQLPATGIPPATLLPEAVYTEAVMTIVAGYTQTAQAPTSTNVGNMIASTQTVEIVPTHTQIFLPTNTPVPIASLTATPQPTQTLPDITPSLPASDPRSGLGEPAFIDRFDSAQNWPIYSDDHVKILIEDGKMIMTARKPDFYNSWILTWPKPEDFYLEATVESGTCGGKDRFGLIFRVPDVSVSEGYLFAFSCNGMYSIWYWDGQKETDLIDWKSSEFIQQGEGKTNRIGVRAEGDQITLYANGNLITSLSDTRLKAGYFGTFVGSAQTTNYTVKFDEIAYWDIK
jgi:hypothetical protein